MSGPKVVRVVTREELIRICERLLRRVDAAQNRWIRLGQKHGVLSAAEIAAAQDRRNALWQLLAEEQFAALQKQAPQEVAFLRQDGERLVSEAAAAAARERLRGHRQREAAVALSKALQAAGQTVPADLAAGLKRGDAEAMKQAWQLLAEAAPAPVERSNELARFYGEGLERRSLEAWLATQPEPPVEPAASALQLKVAELAQLAPETAASFEGRLEALELADPVRSSLLLDSLNLDVGQALSAARNASRLSGELALLLAELELLDGGAAAQMQSQSAGASVAQLRELIEKATAAIETICQRQAAASSRAAILEGLSQLGYEVTETMSTAWVQDGKLVVRNQARPGYGVEVSGDFSAGRAQVRAVAIGEVGATPDPARDRDAETIWCSEVETLNATLKSAGGALEIERALPAGATPLKRVADPQGENRFQGGEVREKQSRHL